MVLRVNEHRPRGAVAATRVGDLAHDRAVGLFDQRVRGVEPKAVGVVFADPVAARSR